MKVALNGMEVTDTTHKYGYFKPNPDIGDTD